MLQDLRLETSKRRKSCRPPITKVFGWNKNLQSNFLLAVCLDKWAQGQNGERMRAPLSGTKVHLTQTVKSAPRRRFSLDN